jgi:hypothetical protein
MRLLFQGKMTIEVFKSYRSWLKGHEYWDLKTTWQVEMIRKFLMLESSKKIADLIDIDSGITNIGFFKLFDQNNCLGNELKVWRTELKVVDASTVYKY